MSRHGPRLAVPAATLIVLACAGCGGDPPRSDVPAPVAALPFELAGTWVEAADPAAPAAGFLALGQRRVVLNLTDLPRGAAAPTACDAEAGLGAGRIQLDNGLQLFLVRGQSAQAQAGVVLDHLDVDIVRAGGGAAVHRRLWSEASVRLAAQAAALAAGMRPAAPLPAPAPAAEPAPTGLAAAVPAARRADAEALMRLAAAGGPAVAAGFATAQRRAWGEVLELLTAAQADPARAAPLLARAAERQREGEAFAAAVAAWKP